MKTPSPPTHLSRTTKKWWREITEEFDLEPHHLKVLQAAAESWDRAQEARILVDKEGLVVDDRFGQPKPHPGCAIERDSRGVFLRCLRELGLDVEPPRSLGRPPKGI